MTARRVLAGLAVFALALGLRLAYVEQQHRVLDLDVSRLTQTDNHVFAAWARIIASGDLLCREQPHAYHHWTRSVAPEGRWLEWYGGAQTYHQSPLYPYMVAAVFHLLGDEHLWVARAQALLSSLTCLLTFVLGLRLLGLRGGLVAGLLLALTGGYVFYDAFLLRDGPMAFFVVVLALGLEQAARRETAGAWLLAGASLGLFSLMKETGPALVVLTLAGLAWRHRREPRRLLLHGGAVLLGTALLLAPAVARNVEVGAPPLKLSTRGPEVIVAGNARGQDGVGWDPPTETLRRVLGESNFSLPGTMLATLGTHRADPIGFVELLYRKTAALFNAYEVPNNVNFYLFRAHLPTLRLAFVGWGLLTPAALLGLVVGLARWRRLLVPYLLFGALTGSIVALYILARFRLQLLPLMALFAAVAIDWAITSWREGRRSALLPAAVFFALAAWWAAPGPEQRDPYNAQNKNTSVMLQLVKVGNIDKASSFYQAQLDLLDEENDPVLAEKLESVDAAFVDFARAQAAPPDSALRHLELARGYTSLVPITKRAELTEFEALARDHYARALQLDPDVAGAYHGLARLEMLLATHPTRAEHGSLGPAVAALVRELERHPEHGPSHHDMGLMHMLRGPAVAAWRTALEHFLRAEATGVESGEADANVALVSVWPGDEYEHAAPLLIDGERVPLHDPERAERYAARAMQRAPDNPRVLRAVSDVHYLRGRTAEAIALLERVLELQPWNGSVAARIQSFRAKLEAGAPASAPAPEVGGDEAGDDGQAAADATEDDAAAPDDDAAAPSEPPP